MMVTIEVAKDVMVVIVYFCIFGKKMFYQGT